MQIIFMYVLYKHATTIGPCLYSSLLHRNPLWLFPSIKSLSSLSQLFATYFSDNISNLHINLLSTISATHIHFSSTSIPPDFPTFASASLNKLSTLISQCSNSYYDLDPIPTSLLNPFPAVGPKTGPPNHMIIT